LSKAESVIFFDVIFIVLLSTYGFSASTGPSFSALKSIPQPALAPLPSSTKCASWDFVCIGINSNALAQATAYIGWAIVNMPVLAVYYLLVTITFSDIVLGIAFAPQLSVNGIPYFGLIFFGLQTYIIFEALRFFRGLSGSAGV